MTAAEKKIRTKLAKFLRLATSSNPHEAELAKKRYDDLSRQSGITIDNPHADPSGMAEVSFTLDPYDDRHHLAASLTMTELGVSVIISRKIARRPMRRMFIVGPEEILPKAKAMFEEVVQEMDRGWEWFESRPSSMERVQSEFYDGVFTAIGLRLADARRRREEQQQPDVVDVIAAILGIDAGEHALALAEPEQAREEACQTYVANNFPEVQAGQQRTRSEVTPSFDHGCHYGLSVRILDLDPVL